MDIQSLSIAIERSTLINYALSLPIGSKITWSDNGYISDRWITTDKARTHFINYVNESSNPCFLDVEIKHE